MENHDASRYLWACRVFDIQPGASSQEVRAAVLSHLEHADFMPLPPWRQAIRMLGDPQTAKPWPEGEFDAFRDAAENRLAELVDQFAAEFFSLSGGPRKVKWTKLLKLVNEYSRLRARLTALQPGLEVEPRIHEVQNQQDAIVVERLRRLFVLKPADQAEQRRQWLATMQGDWRPAVRRVRARYPKLAQLDGEFLSALLASSHGAAAESTGAIAAKTNLTATISPRVNSPAAGAIRKLPNTTANSGLSSKANFGWAGYIAVMVLFSLFRGLAENHTNHNYSPPTPPQKLTTSPTEMERLMRLSNDSPALRRLLFGDSSKGQDSPSTFPPKKMIPDPSPLPISIPQPQAEKDLGSPSRPTGPPARLPLQTPVVPPLAPKPAGPLSPGGPPSPAIPGGKAK